MKYKHLILPLLIFASASISAQPGGDRKFPLVVGFVSYCCGVPDNTPVINFAKSFRKKYKTKAIRAYKIGPVGKEGEYYLAFPLKELSKSQAKNFIEEMEKVTVIPGDKGGVIYERDFTIDSSHFSKSIAVKENILKL